MRLPGGLSLKKLGSSIYNGVNVFDEGKGWSSAPVQNAAQNTVNAAVNQLQNKTGGYGVLANPQVRQQYINSQPTQAAHVNNLLAIPSQFGKDLYHFGGGLTRFAGINTAIEGARQGLADLTGNQAAQAASYQRQNQNWNSFAPGAIYHGLKPFEQSVASTILQPWSNHQAQRQQDYATRVLTPGAQQLYKQYGLNPALANNDVENQALAAGNDVRTSLIERAGIRPTDTPADIRRKVAAQAASFGVNAVFAAQLPGMIPGLIKQGAAKALTKEAAQKALLKGAGSNAALLGAAGVAEVGQSDNPTGRDYLKAGLQGAVTGAALPLAFHGIGALGKGKAKAPVKMRASNSGELGLLTDIADYKMGTYKPPLSEVNDILAKGHNLAKQIGLDITSGSPRDIAERIYQYAQNQRKALDKSQAGSVKVPGKTGSVKTDSVVESVRKRNQPVKPIVGKDPMATLKAQLPEGYNVDKYGTVTDKAGRELTAGEIQSLTQPLYLSYYEGASQVGNREAMKMIAAQYPKDNRVQVGLTPADIKDAMSKYSKPKVSLKNDQSGSIGLPSWLDRLFQDQPQEARPPAINDLPAKLQTTVNPDGTQGAPVVVKPNGAKPPEKNLAGRVISNVREALDNQSGSVPVDKIPGAKLVEKAANRRAKVALKQPKSEAAAPSQNLDSSSTKNTPIESHGTTLGTEVKRALSDKDQVILDELRNIEKTTGQKGLVDQFMYRSNMQRGSNARANVELQNSQNIADAFGGLSKKDYQAFSDYATSRSELSTASKTKATSRPIEDLQSTVANGNEKFGARFEALNRHYKDLADEAYRSGLISKEMLDQYKSNNDYIRLQKDMGDLVQQGGQGRGNAYSLGSTILGQKRVGSTRANLNAGEVAAEYTQQVYREAARNRTATMLADSLEKAGLAERLGSASAAKNQNVMRVLRGGKTEYFKVNPDMKQAIDNINPYHMNVVMKILAAPGRIARAGITGLNPVFIARNLLKDQVTTAINTEHLAATHNPKSFFKGIFNASEDAAGLNKNPLYQDFLKHYGDQTSYDLTRNVKEARQVMNRIRGGKLVGVGQALKSPIRSLENVASVTEKATRFQNYAGEYKRAISEGLSKEAASERAAIAAWQNSVDFSRAGTWGRVINTVVPYWNPSTQGVRQMVRTFSKHPVTSTFKATAFVGVPMVTATAWNLSNPDTKKVYDNIPEYEKENNLILIPPGTKQNKDGTYNVVKIPLPPGIKDAFMPLRRAMESYSGDKPLQGAQVAQDILQTVGGPVNFQSKSAFIGSFLPAAAKPEVQAAMNKDLFTGKQTVPDYMLNATDAQGNPIPASQQAYKGTSGIARIIGKATNVSPIKIEKAVKDIAGTVGLNVLNAGDQALYAAGKIPKEQIGGQSIPEGFKRSFEQAQGITNENASPGAKYYDTLSKVQGELKLTGNEKSAWESLHPSKKNFLGDTIYETDATYNPAARLDVYNRYPKVFELDKRLDAENRAQGKPGNPLYDLTPEQVKKVLEKDNLPPGAKDPELSTLYSKDWYADYATKKSKFFSDLAAQAKAEGRSFGSNDNPYPSTPPALQQIMDSYSALPKGTGARSSWIKSHPNEWAAMQDQFAKIDNWQNIARGKRGLDATEGAVGKANGYDTSSYTPFNFGQNQRTGSPNSGRFSVKLKGADRMTDPRRQVAQIKTKAKIYASMKPKVAIRKSLV